MAPAYVRSVKDCVRGEKYIENKEFNVQILLTMSA